jgi:AcrR family transcriptional regulator
MQTVKSSGRKGEKSRETRRRIVASAGELFVEHGYGATTLQDVAARAGVSVQTIYFVFGNKPSLLKELVDVTIAGDDEPVPTMERAWFVDALATPTAGEHLRAHVRGTAAVLARVAPIIEVVRAAAAQEPRLADLWPQQDGDPRLEVQTTAARSLLAKPGSRPAVPLQEAADVLFSLLSPELYLVMVRDRGWAPDRWADWAYRTLRSQLCE